jgi:hypothetical protein
MKGWAVEVVKLNKGNTIRVNVRVREKNFLNELLSFVLFEFTFSSCSHKIVFSSDFTIR